MSLREGRQKVFTGKILLRKLKVLINNKSTSPKPKINKNTPPKPKLISFSEARTLLASVKEMANVDEAVTFLEDQLDVETASAYFCRRVIWFLHGKRRFADAARILTRLQGEMAPSDPRQKELTILLLEQQLASKDTTGLEAQLAEAMARFPDNHSLRAVSIVALLRRGGTDKARALLWGPPVLDRAALARGLRFLSTLKKADRLMLAEYVAATGWSRDLLHHTPQITALLIDHDRAMEALQMLDAAITASAKNTTPKLHLLSARAAWVVGQRDEAGAALAQVIASANPKLSKTALKTLSIMLKDSVATDRLTLTLAKFDDKIGPPRESGYWLRWIDDYQQLPADVPFSFKPLRRLISACLSTDQITLLHQELQRIPADAALSSNDLLTLLDQPRLSENAATCEALYPHLTRILDPRSAKGIQARLMLLPPGPDFQAAAADCLEHLQSGKRAWDLRFFLAEEWPVLKDRIVDPYLAANLAQQVENAFDAESERSNLMMIAAHRYLHEKILSGLPAPRPAKVSILAPCHRAADLENLRRCVAWQTWTDIELIVVANGPLLDDPLVEETLRGLPGLKILQAAEGRIGRFLNMAIDAASGDYLMRFDSDDLYFENYITNTLQQMQAGNADIAGRLSGFFYSEALQRMFFTLRETTPIGNSPRNTIFYGSSLAITHKVAEKIRFHEDLTRNEDYLFVEAAINKGLCAMILDPFNHVVVRRESKDRHTWHAAVRLVSKTDLLPIGGQETVVDICVGPRTSTLSDMDLSRFGALKFDSKKAK